MRQPITGYHTDDEGHWWRSWRAVTTSTSAIIRHWNVVPGSQPSPGGSRCWATNSTAASATRERRPTSDRLRADVRRETHDR